MSIVFSVPNLNPVVKDILKSDQFLIYKQGSKRKQCIKLNQLYVSINLRPDIQDISRVYFILNVPLELSQPILNKDILIESNGIVLRAEREFGKS
jgi:hypothetical protein